jgi:hypothetical protein
MVTLFLPLTIINLNETVQEAVSNYQKHKSQKERISVLEQRLQNIGLSVRLLPLRLRLFVVCLSGLTEKK